MIVIQQLYTTKWSYRQNQVETVDVWLFYEIVGKVNIFRAEDQGEKDASGFGD